MTALHKKFLKIIDSDEPIYCNESLAKNLEKIANDHHKEASKELVEASIKLQEWHKKYPTGRIYNHSTSLILERELTEIVELQRKALENHLNA